MKVLINKIKKANKLLLIMFILSFILFGISYVVLVKNLLGLKGIETGIRIGVTIFFGIWLIVYLLWDLVSLILRKHITSTVITMITVIFTVVFSVANYYIDVLYTGIDNLQEKEFVTYTSNLVVLNGNEINDDSKLGMISSSDDIEGNVLAKELIKNEKLGNNEVISYVSYYEMLYDLLNGEIEGIFLSSNYKTIFSEEEFEGLNNTVILYSYSKKMENQDTSIKSNKSLTEPFTILLMGVDSELEGMDANATFNGDTLMLITFNPKTLNATMFSIPRDTFVPIACNNNTYQKINSAAAYGTNCVINTVQQLTDIEIDYYVKINFKGVVDLVDALGGIDVFVEAPDYKPYINAHKGKICEQNSLRQIGEHIICIDTGEQHLNGEQALAYARCRHAYLQSDIARNRHQQQIIEAMARKLASPDNINKLEELLNAVTNNLATNMSKNQILSFYEVMKNMIINSVGSGEFLTLQKTYLEYYNLGVRLSNNGILLSAIGYYPDSLNAIVNLMKANLGLEEKEIVKTFSFDANEEYVTKVTGQGITTGEKLETVPNFVGKTIKEIEDWALSRDILVNIEFVDDTSEFYNFQILPGLIANQSVNNGVLINNISEITVYINEVQNDLDNGNIENNENNNSNEEDKPQEDEENDISDEEDNVDDPLDIILPSDESNEDNKTNLD